MGDAAGSAREESDDLAEMTESMAEVMSLGGDVAKLADFYARWAEHYDDDVSSHGYGLPAMMAETAASVAAEADRGTSVIMDAGCGTGLVGVALARSGFSVIDGVDLSPEMVEHARARGVYRRLEAPVDLSGPPPAHLSGVYDLVTVGGVFTVGHVPPEALVPMSRFARPGGILVVSTRRAYLHETAYESVSAELVGSGLFDLLVHVPDAPYTMDSTGDYWVYRVNT